MMHPVVVRIKFFYEEDGRLGVEMNTKGTRGMNTCFYANSTVEAFDRARDIHEAWARSVEDEIDKESIA